MNLLFGLIASSIAGSMVFLTLLLLRPITEKIFSKAWHYYCLIVPLIFLLGGTHVAVSLTSLMPYQASVNISSIPTPQEIPVGIPHEVVMLPISDNLLDMPMRNENDVSLAITPSFASQLITHLERVTLLLLVIWAMGAIMFMVISTKKYLQYRRIVLHNAKSITDIDCKIPLAVSGNAHTPMLIGVIKPIIVLPNIYFADEELDMILAHEMVHYRRKDLLVKLLMLIANAVHWFNPAVYALNKQLDAMCELSCDEKVVSEMDTQNRRFYGETILQVLQHSTAQKNLVGNVAFATNLCNSKKNFKRRLISMMNAKKMKKSMATLALVAGMLIALGGFAISHLLDSAISVYAASQREDTRLSEDFQEFEMTVTVLATTADGVETVPSSDTLSPDDAAIIGAQYIWEMFEENIDGKFIALAYNAWSSYTRAWWSGMVSESETAFYDNQMLFFFIIDAVTGERIDIVCWRSEPHSRAEEVGEALLEVRRNYSDRSRIYELMQGGSVPEQLDEYARIAKEHASRHFVNTEVVDVEFMGVAASGFDFDENRNLIVTSRIMSFEVTDCTGRVAHVSFDEATGKLDRIITQHNDIMPSFDLEVDSDNRPLPPRNPDGSLG